MRFRRTSGVRPIESELSSYQRLMGASSFLPRQAGGPPSPARAVALEALEHVVGLRVTRLRGELRGVVRAHAAAAEEEKRLFARKPFRDLREEFAQLAFVAIARPDDERNVGHVPD